MSFKDGDKVVMIFNESVIGVVDGFFCGDSDVISVMWPDMSVTLEDPNDLVHFHAKENESEGKPAESSCDKAHQAIEIACALIREGLSDHDIVGVKAAKIVKSIYEELAK